MGEVGLWGGSNCVLSLFGRFWQAGPQRKGQKGLLCKIPARHANDSENDSGMTMTLHVSLKMSHAKTLHESLRVFLTLCL